MSERSYEGCYCVDGCGNPATTDRVLGFSDDTPIVELVCAKHEFVHTNEEEPNA